ncbi:MAG: hypothetical protein QOH41_2926 [Blastocatellia bacterium]|jgi:hypothetical protein|nr:hypothetical protein [Blastocatellia bacterium]
MKSFESNSRKLSLAAVCLAIVLVAMPARAAVGDEGPLNPGDVLIGPCGVPGAMGPGGVNDDFTNRSISTGIASVAPGGLTTAAGTVVFRNTIQNTGAGDDLFLISAPTPPAGFMIEISTDNGEHYVMLNASDSSVALPVSYRAAAIVMVRVTAPSGLPVLTGFDTVVRVASTVTPIAANETIDRLYTGFIRLDRSATVVNSAGNTAMAPPGAEIEFAITYSNVSSAAGLGNALLTAQNLVISENGNSAPNNWGETTEHIVGASDTRGGIIIGDQGGSKSLTDIVSTLEAGQSGVFKFKRRVK